MVKLMEFLVVNPIRPGPFLGPVLGLGFGIGLVSLFWQYVVLLPPGGGGTPTHD